MRYVPRPRSYVDEGMYEGDPEHRDVTVYTPEVEGPRFSGLYDHMGRPLYKEREPIGYRIRNDRN